jgi:hypothetical protein
MKDFRVGDHATRASKDLISRAFPFLTTIRSVLNALYFDPLIIAPDAIHHYSASQFRVLAILHPFWVGSRGHASVGIRLVVVCFCLKTANSKSS